MSIDRIDSNDQQCLLAIARQSIAGGLAGQDSGATAQDKRSPALQQRRGNFVTLSLEGRLHGCIGALEPSQMLAISVSDNAYRAAFADTRFVPVSTREFEALAIAISVLDTPEPLTVAGETELCHLLCPHRDGLILELGVRRATFLPSVWSQLPEPARFVAELKVKAGLPRTFWSNEIRAWRYGAQYFSEAPGCITE